MKKYTITKSTESKYVWFQIAKNATRTTVNYLNENTKVDFGFPLHLDKDSGYGKSYESEYDNYFKFTIVRNPWDRLLSFYYNKLHGKDVYGGNYSSFSECNTFEDFIYALKPRNLKKCNGHFKLQTEMFPLDSIDFIGKFENFSDDFGIICGEIGIPRQDIPHRNKSFHRYYTKYYSDGTRKVVAEKYASDIEQFGYEFGK